MDGLDWITPFDESPRYIYGDTPANLKTVPLKYNKSTEESVFRSWEKPKMEKRKSKVIACLAVWIITIFSISVSISCVDDKCGACNAVAEELELGLSNEKPRNHLDMRHRLDSTGQRRGKVIDYRVSELRVVELLDGLCEKMQEYTLEKIGSTREWIKVVDWNILSIDKQEARVHSKHISSYCGRLLEETEDELTELIKKGSIRSGDVSKVLCQDLSKHCDKTRASPQIDAEDDDLDKEL